MSLNVGETAALLAASGGLLDRLMVVAGRVRDAGLVAVGRPGVVTYSRRVFIPLTRSCRDTCHYCTFLTTLHVSDDAVGVGSWGVGGDLVG